MIGVSRVRKGVGGGGQAQIVILCNEHTQHGKEGESEERDKGREDKRIQIHR